MIWLTRGLFSVSLCGMARKPRSEFEGAIYHVMCRGDRQEAIFRDEKDHERFLKKGSVRLIHDLVDKGAFFRFPVRHGKKTQNRV
jgi:hypothetical protein